MADDVAVAIDTSIGPARLSRAWRRAALVVVAVFAAVFVAQHHEDVPDAWEYVRAAGRWWLALAAGLTATWLVNLGLLQSAAQRAAGLPTRRFTVAVATI